MTSTSTKMMALLDENKETLSSDLYLKMSNLLLETNKSETEKTYKKYKIKYMHTFYSQTGHGSNLSYSEQYENYEEDSDMDGDNPEGNDYQLHHNILEKTVYVLNTQFSRLEPGCNIEFKNIDGLEYIQLFPFTNKKVLQKVGEYKNRINLYHNENILISIK